MLIVQGRTVHFDVDDTLLMWGRTTAEDPNGLKVVCPPSDYYEIPAKGVYSSLEEEAQEIGGWIEYLSPHKKHVEQLKLHALRGHKVIVWSAGGWAWANSAVRALGLEQYVFAVMDKPSWCYDDKKPEEYMPKSQWIEYKE